MTAVVLVHGRSQQMKKELGREPDAVDRFVASKKRMWLAGLAKGCVLAGLPPIPPEDAYFPYYGNDLADAITAWEADGQPRPELETAGGRDIAALSQQLVVDSAEAAGFRATQHLAGLDDEVVEAVREAEQARAAGQEIDVSPVLRLTIVRTALQFLSAKTGAADWVIEGFLRDVAYYLADDAMRDLVQDVVRRSVEQAIEAGHDDLVLVGHSLGSIVTYDTLQAGLPDAVTVRLLVTAGSPLGQPAVRRNLRGPGQGSADREVPPGIEPAHEGAPVWVNAFDVRDVVSIVHPIAPLFRGGDAIRDERTHNPGGAHSIEDYLADPDVAGPIARVHSGAGG